MKQRYKIHISERNYSNYTLLDTMTLNKLDDIIDMNPAQEKLFSNDLFEWDDTKDINQCFSEAH